MGKIIGLSVILLILFGLSCFVLILLIQDKTPENYIFLGFLILLFSSIFCVGLFYGIFRCNASLCSYWIIDSEVK